MIVKKAITNDLENINESHSMRAMNGKRAMRTGGMVSPVIGWEAKKKKQVNIKVRIQWCRRRFET